MQMIFYLEMQLKLISSPGRRLSDALRQQLCFTEYVTIHRIAPPNRMTA